jgi:hypothetical protein
MKNILAAAVLPTLVLPFNAIGQDVRLQDFTRMLKVADGLQLSIVHINGRTVPVMFQPPTLYTIRARASEVTMFYVQGTPEKDVTFDPAGFAVQQASESIPTTTVNIAHFVKGKVAKGDRIDGMLQLAKQIDITKPFTVAHGKDSVQFKFSDDLVKAITPPSAPEK